MNLLLNSLSNINPWHSFREKLARKTSRYLATLIPCTGAVPFEPLWNGIRNRPNHPVAECKTLTALFNCFSTPLW